MGLFLQVHAQIIKGIVLDETEQPLMGASVFFNSTTLGTITDFEGKFEIKFPEIQDPVLIIQYVGYENILITDFSYTKFKIKLTPKVSLLQEVVVTPNPFSREACLEAFKQNFLGTTKAGKSCKILNEDVLVFNYDVTTNTLYAFANEPLLVNNTYLGYKISFNLVNFHVKFNERTLDFSKLNENFFLVTTFYKELDGNNKKFIKNREEVYKGSVMHFFRTLTSENFKKEGFLLGTKGFVDPIEKHFSITKEDNLYYIDVVFDNKFKKIDTSTIPKKIINVYYKQNPSNMHITTNQIVVDEFGNFAPITDVRFGGIMGTYKAGNLLPSNFKI